MPVVKPNFDIIDVLSRKNTSGVLSYFVKLSNSTGIRHQWLPAWAIGNNERVANYEKELRTLSNLSRDKRLKRRQEIRKLEAQKSMR